MPTKYTCPDCQNEVLVPNKAADIIGPWEELGCNNLGNHDDGEVTVMKEA